MTELRGVGAPQGPRVLGRLTPELILRSPQYMNCVKEYELDLRANRLTMIENLGATEVRAAARSLADVPG
jgi:U2 small nuclear ribonucleoprotein A'